MIIEIIYILIGIWWSKPYWWDHPRANGSWEIREVDFISLLVWLAFWPILMILRILIRGGF